MSIMRLQALGYLGYRALLAHPLKRLRQHGSGLERFAWNYQGEGLVPTSPEDREIGEAASGCIACGLCETGCELAAAAPSVRDLGLHATFRLYSRSAAETHHAAAALAACTGCGGCEALCPTGVPIGRIVRHLLGRLAGASPTPSPEPTQRTAANPSSTSAAPTL